MALRTGLSQFPWSFEGSQLFFLEMSLKGINVGQVNLYLLFVDSWLCLDNDKLLQETAVDRQEGEGLASPSPHPGHTHFPPHSPTLQPLPVLTTAIFPAPYGLRVLLAQVSVTPSSLGLTEATLSGFVLSLNFLQLAHLGGLPVFGCNPALYMERCLIYLRYECCSF